MDKVTGSTVNRELNLLSNVFAVAAKEWKWIAVSPTTDVRRPKESKPRDRLYTNDEIERICFALGFDLGDELQATTVSQRVAVAFLFAIETAMRAGEICGLRPRDVVGRVATLTETKNGTKRQVPLTKRAVELLELLPVSEESATIFDISSKSLDTLFRKAKARAAIDDATFHDSRHLAITGWRKSCTCSTWRAWSATVTSGSCRCTTTKPPKRWQGFWTELSSSNDSSTPPLNLTRHPASRRRPLFTTSAIALTRSSRHCHC